MHDFKKLKVVALRAELSLRNLPQTGKRDELIERLEEYEFEHGDPPLNETDDNEVIEEKVKEIAVDDVADNQVRVESQSNHPMIQLEAEIENDVEIEEIKEKKTVEPITNVVVAVPIITPSLPTVSTVTTEQPQTPITLELSEEEKLQARARRFGLDFVPTANIELTIQKLQHSLPFHSHSQSRSYRHRHSYNNNNHRKIYSSASVNKP